MTTFTFIYNVKSAFFGLALYVLCLGLCQAHGTGTSSSAIKCEGEAQEFHAASENLLNLLYQWQVSTDNGSNWSDLVNDPNFTGVNQATLTVFPPLSFNGHLIRCRMSDGILTPEYSTPETITVQAQTSIQEQPQPVLVMAQDMALFSVTAEGTNITYQWQVNQGNGWSPIADDAVYSGDTTATLVIFPTPWFMHQYQYRCVVSGDCGPAAVSDAAPLTIIDLFNYITQPIPAKICEGKVSPFTLYVFEGDQYTYQWQESRDGGIQWSNLSEGSPYGNVTTSSLNVLAELAVNGFLYRCRVNLGTELFTSEAVKLEVLPVPVIDVQPAPMMTCLGSTAAFKVAATGKKLLYQWQVNTGDGSWSDITDDEVYSGANTQNLALTGVSAALNGFQYRCSVTGNCPPDIISAAATLKVLGPNTWKGITADWQDAQNWCGQVPDTTTDVTIQAGVAYMPLAASAYCRNLTVESGAFITMTGAFTIQGTPTLLGELIVGAQTLTLNGDPIQGNPAHLRTLPTSTLVMGGNATGAYIPATVTALNKLVLNHSSSGGVNLVGNLTLNALELQQGRLFLNTSNLKLLAPGAISGADSTRYVVTNDDPETGGFLMQPVLNNETYVSFPVGTAKSYSPAKIKLSLVAIPDSFRIRVFDMLFTGGTTGAKVTSNAVNKTWLIEEAVVGGSNATVNLGWLDKAELNGFKKDKAIKAHFKNDKWEFTNDLLGYTKDPQNINWANQGVYTDFSPFGVVDEELMSSTVNVKVILHGPYNATSNLMRTNLNSNNLIPTAQPYNIAPWNYNGLEVVASDFFTNINNTNYAEIQKIVDWVLVEIRKTVNGSSFITQKACFLKNDGTIVDLDGVNSPIFDDLPMGDYFIVVRHRNHLPVITAKAISLTNLSNIYDFTTGQDKAYGNKPMYAFANNKFAMFAGDINQDKIIKYNLSSNDRLFIYRRIGATSNINLTVKGYLPEDLNLDGIVKYNLSGNDRLILYQSIGAGSNINLTKTSQVPL